MFYIKCAALPTIAFFIVVVFFNQPQQISDLYQPLTATMIAILVVFFATTHRELLKALSNIHKTSEKVDAAMEVLSNFDESGLSKIIIEKPLVGVAFLKRKHLQPNTIYNAGYDCWRTMLSEHLKAATKSSLITTASSLYEHLDVLDTDKDGQKEGASRYLENYRSIKNLESMFRLYLVSEENEDQFLADLQDHRRLNTLLDKYGNRNRNFWVRFNELKHAIPKEAALFDEQDFLTWDKDKKLLFMARDKNLSRVLNEILNGNHIYNEIKRPDEYR